MHSSYATIWSFSDEMWFEINPRKYEGWDNEISTALTASSMTDVPFSAELVLPTGFFAFSTIIFGGSSTVVVPVSYMITLNSCLLKSSSKLLYNFPKLGKLKLEALSRLVAFGVLKDSLDVSLRNLRARFFCIFPVLGIFNFICYGVFIC